MVAFAVCLLGAGALLSLLIRAPGLLVVLIAFGVLIAAMTLLSPVLGAGHSTPITLLVALVSLQVGYGVALVLRALVLGYFKRRRERDPQAPGSVPRRWSQSHDGGPMNHP